MSTGVHSLSDLLAYKNTTVVDFGLERIAEIVQNEINAHNLLVEQMITELAEPTTERGGTSGASIEGQMVRVDEYARVPTQRGLKPANVAFPLEKFQFALGWTNDFFITRTPADLAIMTQRATRADLLNLQKEIKRALFLSGNYTFIDVFKDGASLNVKRLVNADGDVIPAGPNGESFDGATHTHYDATATFTATNLEALINDVVEHGHGEGLRVYINKAQEGTVRAFTGFTAYLDARIVGATNANQAVGRLDTTRVDNRAIGLFNGAEVWVKPWIPTGYVFAFAAGDNRKPLRFRQMEEPALRGLRLAAELNTHPLYARYMERYFGLGVWTRTNGAVLYTAGAAYVDPTIS